MSRDHHEKAKMVRVRGLVYCYEHGDVHDDTTNPFHDGAPCVKEEHRKVYFKAKKGDWK